MACFANTHASGVSASALEWAIASPEASSPPPPGDARPLANALGAVSLTLGRCSRGPRHASLSSSSSLSADSSGEDDDLPDVKGMAPGVSASGPAPLGGGGEDASGLAITRPGSKADTPEMRALGKRTVSPVGSTAVVEQAAVGATQLPPQRVEGAPESDEGRLAPVDTGAVPPPLPPPL